MKQPTSPPEVEIVPVQTKSLAIPGRFIRTATLKIGDPTAGKVPEYAGRLLSVGADLEQAPDENGEIRVAPTFLFSPLDWHTLEPDPHRQDRVICSAQLARDLRQILAQAMALSANADVIIRWAGIIRIAGGAKALNTFDIAVSYLPRDS